MAPFPDEEGNQTGEQAGRGADKNMDADIVGQKFDGRVADNPSDDTAGDFEDSASG